MIAGIAHTCCDCARNIIGVCDLHDIAPGREQRVAAAVAEYLDMRSMTDQALGVVRYAPNKETAA